MSELPKTHDPQAVENKWYQFWLDRKCFVADPARVSEKRPPYSIVIPPPNITGVLHMGHVLNNTIQDILARKARMDGKEVFWLPGTDHASIATHMVIERQLKKEEGITRYDLGREKFIERAWEWREKHGGIIVEQLKRLGCSCDWTRERFTMDPEYSNCVQRVFVDLYKKGLIYRGKRMVNWCPATLTALSDEEVVMKEQKGFLWYFKVEVVEEPGTFLTIATTRPETIPGDTAIAVSPKDERYQHLIGKHAKRPLPVENQAPLPILADDHIDPEFGTGVLKVTPAHDKADFEIGERHNLDIIDIMNPDGTMNGLAGNDLKGLDRFQARKVAAEKLEEIGSLEKEEPYTNNVGFSERADVPIEPRLSEQWFLKYPSVQKSRDCVATGVMKFHPERWAKVYDHWMDGIKDWCISRQLWWGHRIPVWYNRQLEAAFDSVPETVRISGHEIAGTNARSLRRAAINYAREHGILGTAFSNEQTGCRIRVRLRSLTHAFTHEGIDQIKAVAALPELLRTAVCIGSEHHEPATPDIPALCVFWASLTVGKKLYAVKITVKALRDGSLLYDHLLLKKKNAPDGETDSAVAQLPGEPLASRPSSGTLRNMPEFIEYVKKAEWKSRCQIECPGEGWKQDPDVLDTWFSSWLWPFATMGWTGDQAVDPKNDLLKTFYPTTDLVTGPDIIFFWVARMIMAGYEYMGDLPFRNVYFTGIIRDKQGRKMSKSLGNSPDPLELIDKYGADALRFGVMRSAPLGQDVIYDEKNVELGRNFCTKLWNACRFRQMASGDDSSIEGEIQPGLLTSDDKWILLRLDAAIREVTQAFADYKFTDATATLYRFFWSEFCDWYIEASKAAFFGEDAAIKTNTLAVMDFVLSHSLRLFHPFLPFITEELWQGMGYNQDLPAGQGGETIMFANWPKPLDDEFKTHYGLDESDERVTAAKYELVSLGRGLRQEFNIASNKKIRFILKPNAELSPHETEVIRILLNAEPLEVEHSFQASKTTPSVLSPFGELFLPLEGVIDFETEKKRLNKELQKIEKEIEKAKGKLDNPQFREKVPAHILEEHQQRLDDWQTKHEKTEAALAALEG